jgi:exonuclease III
VLIHSWNIQAGGGTRLREILATIDAHGADTLVLGETTRTRIGDLTDGLRALGFTGLHAPELRNNDRGVLIASKRPFEVRSPSAKRKVPGHRWAEVWFPGKGITLAGIYFPDTAAPIAALWPRVHEAAQMRREEPYLLVGDLNSGSSLVDAEAYAFASDPWFSAMPYHGMVDLFRHKHRDRREYSWYSKRGEKRNGFRLDHAFGTLAIRRRVRNVWYSHSEREHRVSNHSSLLVAIR